MSDANTTDLPPEHPVTRIEQAAKQLDTAAADERLSEGAAAMLSTLSGTAGNLADHVGEELEAGP